MNKIAADASAFIRVISEYFKSITVEPVKTILGAKPQEPFLVLYAADHCIVGKAVLDLVMTEIIRLPGHIKGQKQ